MALNKPVDEITEVDLDALVAESVDERKVIDYKAGWDLSAPGWKDEFRRDVSSFANSSGGHLIFGLRENGGVPQEVVGLDISSPEEVRLRLSEILQAHIRPRIPSIEIGVVSPLANGKAAAVIRIPRSFAKPHQITPMSAPQDFQFWARNAAGKYRLDVDELRAAFTLSEGLGERVRAFRLDRLASIIAGESPVPLDDGMRIVLHLVPLSAFDPATRHNVKDAAASGSALDRWGAYRRYNFEGFLAFRSRPSTRYLQVMRTGALEAVATDFDNVGLQAIATVNLEHELLVALPELLGVQRRLGVDPPILVMLSLVGVKDFRLGVPGGLSETTITHDVVPISAELVDSFVVDPATVMVPIYNTIWNAAGLDGSVNFKDGQWVRGQ